VRHVQQPCHLADGVHLVLVQAGIGIGHLPHRLDEFDLLRLGEVVVEVAGEALVVVGGLGRVHGQLHQAVDFVVGEGEALAQGADHGIAFRGVHGGIGAHHLHQQHGGGQLHGMRALGGGGLWRKRGGEAVEQFFEGLEHVPA